MDVRLNKFERLTIPYSKEYRAFIKEMKKTPLEMFYMDGERKFSEMEKKYLKVFNEIEMKEARSNYTENQSNYHSLVEHHQQKVKEETINFSERYEEELEATSVGFGIDDVVFGDDFYSNQQKHSIMSKEKQFDKEKYLQNQMKYLGFGESEQLHTDLKKGLVGDDKSFVIKISSEKTMPGNKADFQINFSKSDKGGVFLNSYDANLTNSKGETISHRFKVKKEDNITAKEAINLLEGRTVKTAFLNSQTNEKESTFIKLKLNEEKNDYNNYQLEFYKEKNIDVEKIVEKSNLIFDKPEYKDFTVKALEKGNLSPVKFKHENTTIEGKASLNPQYKTLNLYDKDMNRVNTNKALKGLEMQDNYKSNVKEHSSRRSL